jgi:hypothetical protein
LAPLAPETSGKRLELLKEIVPKLSRVAVFGTSTFPGNAQSLREVELAAGAFKVQVSRLQSVPALQSAPARRANEQLPLTQLSVVQVLLSLQSESLTQQPATGEPPTQAPPRQASPVVQALLSEQVAVLFVKTH